MMHGPRRLGRSQEPRSRGDVRPKAAGHGDGSGDEHEDRRRRRRGKSGASVHLVDEDYDTGPVIAQAEVAVLEGDTPDALGARVQEQERALLVDVLARIADGRTAAWPCARDAGPTASDTDDASDLPASETGPGARRAARRE